MPTRSTKLASATAHTNVELSLFTVPNGMTFLTKDIVIYNDTATTTQVRVRLLSSDGVDFVRVIDQQLAQNQHFEWSGWIAANPGDQLLIFSTLTFVFVWVSGAKLIGTA
jgi:hypothetical protein